MPPAAAIAPHESSGSLLPRRLSAEDRRTQILDMAAELFIQRGFESVGMADLAQALRISRPTIYTYFASTEDMLDALLEARLEGLPGRLHPYLHSPTDSETAFDRLFLALLEERDLLMLLHSGGGPLFRQKRRTFLQALESRLQLAELPRAQRSGPAGQQLIFLMIHLLSSAAYAELTEEPFDPRALAATLGTFVGGGIRALAAEPEHV
ncbi:TetR family transcriptional regulator [Deinococcus piscis]|uniref:TetR family transcriptional regulator n=1 Tax=Deinococcus piscis TaxID=394230 RepID=A0ABQ3JZP1_9DEIO|nr:TetR/AcrR family transcriptional regulator [Deinococcus piscis]GHF93963.1 TetR family transcriptional regulator [Deinococcus piscis]